MTSRMESRPVPRVEFRGRVLPDGRHVVERVEVYERADLVEPVATRSWRWGDVSPDSRGLAYRLACQVMGARLALVVRHELAAVLVAKLPLGGWRLTWAQLVDYCEAALCVKAAGENVLAIMRQAMSDEGLPFDKVPADQRERAALLKEAFNCVAVAQKLADGGPAQVFMEYIRPQQPVTCPACGSRDVIVGERLDPATCGPLYECLTCAGHWPAPAEVGQVEEALDQVEEALEKERRQLADQARADQPQGEDGPPW